MGGSFGGLDRSATSTALPDAGRLCFDRAVCDGVERLTGSDFEDAMSLLGRVFGASRSFDRLLPSVYQPTDEAMGQNLAIRRAGRIVAMVGLFPATWNVGGTALRVGRIGGVAVDRAERGKGLMRRLMQAAQQQMVEQRYDLGFLGGRRSLYSPFGFERAGTELVFHLSPHDLRRRVGSNAEAAVTLESPAPDIAAILVRFGEHQPLHCVRAPRDFCAHLEAWLHEPMVARDRSGEVVGYLTGDRDRRRVTEIAACSPTAALGMLDQWAGGTDVAVATSTLPTEFVATLFGFADQVEAVEAGNWWVLDWPRVLGALLAVRHAARPLCPGRVTLEIEGESGPIELRVDHAGAHCAPTDASPMLAATASTWLRYLTGPAPTACELDLGPARVLAEWCPLPLWLSRQDHV
jgi:predicted N-acetyltransferase YhbS